MSSAEESKAEGASEATEGTESSSERAEFSSGRAESSDASDDLKASVLSTYGNTVCQTPNIDRLAKSGMVFEHAYCQGLACSPSRPSMLRSIYPKSKSTAPTIGEHLQKHGMHTARVGKIFHMPVPHAQLDGSDGRDVAECWTERYNTKSAVVVVHTKRE